MVELKIVVFCDVFLVVQSSYTEPRCCEQFVSRYERVIGYRYLIVNA